MGLVQLKRGKNNNEWVVGLVFRVVSIGWRRRLEVPVLFFVKVGKRGRLALVFWVRGILVWEWFWHGMKVWNGFISRVYSRVVF